MVKEADYRTLVGRLQRMLGERVPSGLSVAQVRDAMSLVEAVKTAVLDADTPPGLEARQALTHFSQRVREWVEIDGRSSEAAARRESLLGEISSAATLISAALLGLAGPALNTRRLRLSRLGLDHYWRVLEACSVDGMPGVYVIGCFDKKRTILTQQERAIWLAASIVYTWSRPDAPRVGIIGAGVAGVTCSAALLLAGARVTLLERTDEILTLQRRNTTRYIHPHLYDWPLAHAENPNAGLPILDWRAGMAKDVASQIEGGFKKFAGRLEGGEPRFDFVANDVVRSGGTARSPAYSVVTAQGEAAGEFDLVVVAIGFGLEAERGLGVSSPSYWENESLHPPGRFTRDNTGRILISGAGDGGLVDVMRACLKDFDHSTILKLIPGLNSEEVRKKLLAIEEAAKLSYHRSPDIPFLFSSAYKEAIPHSNVNTAWASKINKLYDVTFNTLWPGWFQLGSALLNRSIVYYLAATNVIHVRSIRLTPTMITKNEDESERRYSIKWTRGHPHESYDKIVVRHGIASEYFRNAFPNIYEGCSHMEAHLAVLDLPTLLPAGVIQVLQAGFSTAVRSVAD